MARNHWGSVRKYGNRYRATYRIKGKEYKAPTTFPTKALARSWLAKQQAEIIAIKAGFKQDETSRPQKGEQTFKILVMDFLSDCEKRGLTPGTLRSYRSLLEHCSDLNDLKCEDVTETTLKDWNDSQNWSSAKVQAKTLRTLKGVLVFAEKNDYLRMPKFPNIPTTKKSSRRVKPLSVEELNRLREICPPEYRVMIDLAGWCAMRFGEIQALRRKDIDATNGVIHIRRGISRGVGGLLVEGVPKSSAGVRDVAIPPRALERVKKHLSEHVGKSADSLVVHMRGKPNNYLTNKSVHYWFDRAVDEIGRPGFRFHDLRHTGLTLAGLAGATLAELMHRAGHSEARVAMIYQHASFERDRELASRLEDL